MNYEVIFITSKLFYRYPVILSIENHCGLKQQDEMAKTMKRTFGTKLFYYSDEELATLKRLPSPEQLKNKILVKVICNRITTFEIACIKIWV